MKTNTTQGKLGLPRIKLKNIKKIKFPEYFPLQVNRISCFIIDIESNIKQ